MQPASSTALRFRTVHVEYQSARLLNQPVANKLTISGEEAKSNDIALEDSAIVDLLAQSHSNELETPCSQSNFNMPTCNYDDNKQAHTHARACAALNCRGRWREALSAHCR